MTARPGREVESEGREDSSAASSERMVAAMDFPSMSWAVMLTVMVWREGDVR